jgi:cytochrome oxidase Cu insertion factor (SCO1/SenC/PrrC family)
MTRKDAWPLGAVGFILTVSAAWWTLALWSVPAAPEWLERARSVCFNLTESGLPDTKGWLLLIGQPPVMFAFLWVGWGSSVRASFGRLLAVPSGRFAMVGVVTAAVTGLSLAGARVLDARLPEVAFGVDEPAPETYPRLDRPWPGAEGLVDQSGALFGLERLEGRAALVTFAFGHCVTLCPVVVHQSRQTRLEARADLAIVVITLDPWRDTPARLPALVSQFELDPARDFVLSGSVDDVNRYLDAWGIPRERDELTGDVVHPGIVYMVEPDGTLAYASTGGVTQMVSLALRLERSGR